MMTMGKGGEIYNICLITYTDAPINQMTDPIKVLAAVQHLKKKKYLQPCLDQRHHLTPFTVSVDGLIGKEANTVLKVLAVRTTTKAGKMYANIIGYTRACLSIAIVRATHVCLRGSIVLTSGMSNIRPHWEDTAGMTLIKF
jgi:hypothetical protein